MTKRVVAAVGIEQLFTGRPHRMMEGMLHCELDLRTLEWLVAIATLLLTRE